MGVPQVQNACVTWRGAAVPVSIRFDDPYYSLEDGLVEAEHVYLGGNDLPARYRAGFHIAELGFGTGLNALAAARAWVGSGQDTRLTFTSFEALQLDPPDMARALEPWPALAPWSVPLTEAWRRGERRIALPGLDLTVIEGDAREILPAWTGCADAWFLDGFCPARNPEMWEPGLLAAVGGHTRPGGTCATFSAAGAVRARLNAAGFDVTRAPGFRKKRHMTRGVLADA